jgi:hypothetical protein
MASIGKLGRPSADGLVRRTRLLARLDEACAKAAVWVCGPPGAGKTSLVASWLAGRDAGGVWYQIDSGDDDIAGFFHDLALAAAEAGVRADLPAFAAEHALDVAGFARRWFRTLWGHAPRPFWLVLDNYQEASPGAQLHAALREALTERPAGVVAVVISRNQPPPALARLRANRRLLELGWDELRLSPEEGAALAEACRPGRAPEVGALVKRCDGWAAGLVLLFDLDSLSRAPAAGPRSREALFDYFMTELFDRLDPAMRRLLLATCMAPWIDVATAVSLAGDEQAGARLEELRRKHLFTELRDEGSYRYHALFREFLQSRLAAERGQDGAARIARHSAALMFQAGDRGAAFELYLAAGEPANAAELVLAAAPELLRQGRRQTLESWIDALPVGQVEGRPWLIYWQAVSCSVTDLVGGRRLFERVFEGFVASGDVRGQVQAASGIIECLHLDVFGGCDVGALEQWSETLSGALTRAGPELDPDIELVALTALVCAGLMMQPVRPRLEAWAGRIKALMARAQNADRRLQAALAMLNYYEFLAISRELRELSEEVRPLLSDPSLSTQLLCQWLANQALIKVLFLGDEPGAFAQLDRAVELAEQGGLGSILPFVWLTSAVACLAVGDPVAAQRRLLAIASAPGAMGGVVDTLVGGAALQSGRLEEGLDLVRRGCASACATGSWMIRVGCSFFLATAEAVAGSLDAAMEAVGDNQALYEPFADGGRVYHAGLVQAFVQLRRGEEAAAAASLRLQLSAWRREGVRASFVWNQPLMAPLLGFALKRGVEREYVEALIRRRRLRPPSRDQEDWPWPIRIFALGRFEVILDGAPLPRGRKAPRRLLVVLKTLAALGGEGVSEDRLADLLWPDHEGDAARDLLSNNLLRLRRLLGAPEAIEVREGRVTLRPDLVWIDARSFDRAADRALAGGDGAQQALELYRGPLLADEPDLPGAHGPRDRLRAKFLRLAERMLAGLEQAGDYAAADALCARVLDAEPEAQRFRRDHGPGPCAQVVALRSGSGIA